MYDVIVIGSGMGGLTAAGLLAGVVGQRVLVLEKHTEPGGQTHVFRRDGASWDVGLHYVGQLAPGSSMRAYMDYLSGGALQWTRLPEAFDRFIYPGLDFGVPSDPQQYQQKLVAAFPDEARAIGRYFRDIQRAARWSVLGFMRHMVPRPVAPVLRWLQRLTAGQATQSTKHYLAQHFRSPQLQALLASQWGDYGLPPAHSAFATHALIVSHYLHGAWFPQGGSSRIARTFEKNIERHGGSVRVAQEVREILVENGRATGVRVLDRRGPQPVERVLRAPLVISNVGARLTYQHLLPTHGEVGAATAAVRAEMDQIGTGFSAVTLYLRLNADARSLGVKGENFWINTDLNHDDIQGQTQDLMQGKPRRAYVSFPSIKSGEMRWHTAEIIGLVDPQAFASWQTTPKGYRGAGYAALKDRITQGLLGLAETALPGFGALVTYAELATPLTFENFTSHPRGVFYGIPATPQRLRSDLLGPRTPIEGLYLSGQDAGSLGIVGAMMGGVVAACQALGARGYPMIQAALRRQPAAPTAASPLPPEKCRAVLSAKRALTPSIWALSFEVEGALTHFAAGQYARVHVGHDEWRDYSIAGVEGTTVRFLISTRTGGHGSRFAETAKLGTQTLIELPLGEYTLAPHLGRQVFVATGTGLAPFLPMFETLARAGQLDHATLLFGCATAREDITTALGPLPPQVMRCFSRAPAPEGGMQGRVTDGIARLSFEPTDTAFYVCGASAMVADCKALLESRGALHVFIEGY